MKDYKKLTLFLICAVLLKIALAFLAGSYSSFSLRNLFTSVLNQENIVSLTNESRKAVGLHGLKVNSKLESAAQKKAEDMLGNQYFSHTDPSGRKAWDFMRGAGYNYLYAGENLAVNFNSAEDVTDGWLASASHKENILSDKYTQIGVGIAAGKFFGANSTVVVQMFGKPLRESALISTITLTAKKLKKTGAAKTGKGLKKYISKLVQNNAAEWFPFAKTSQIYLFSELEIPVKSLFNMFFTYIVACSACLFAWRFFKEKKYRDKKLCAYALLVFVISLALAVL